MNYYTLCRMSEYTDLKGHPAWVYGLAYTFLKPERGRLSPGPRQLTSASRTGTTACGVGISSIAACWIRATRVN